MAAANSSSTRAALDPAVSGLAGEATETRQVRVNLDAHKEFNRALLEFIRDLAKSFPHVEDFRRAYASTNLMATLNPVMVQTLFNRFVGAYTDKILHRDESFFLQKDYSSDLAAAGESGGAGGSVEVVTVLKGIWATLAQGDKESIWRHLEVLVALNHALQSKKTV